MTEENTTQEKSSSGSGVAFLALLVAFAGVGAAGYLWTNQQSLRADFKEQLSDQAVRVADYGSQIKSLNQQGEASLGEAQKSADSASKLEARVTGLAHEVSSITGLSRVDWQVAHAEHLIRAAHQRLVLTSDTDGALALLDAADKVVGDIKEIGTINVRRAFAKNLNDLSVASRVDIEGIFVKLDALQEQISQLSVPELSFEANSAKLKAAEEDAGFNDKVSTTVANLFSVITEQYSIQQLDEPVKPLLSTDQRTYLQQNLGLLVEQAQLAAIKGNATIYRRLLSQAEDWVRAHFNLETAAAQATLVTFQQLANVELSPQVPDVTESMRALKVFTELWNKEKEIRQASVGKELMDAGLVETAVAKDAPAAEGASVAQESVSTETQEQAQ